MESTADPTGSTTTPVIGIQPDAPTSGDVHLFPDHRTYNEERPIYYADCEGFSGGKGVPIGSSVWQEVRKTRHHQHGVKTAVHEMSTKYSEKGRDWVVKTLYPKALFTFSDVVVLVTRNFRLVLLSMSPSWLLIGCSTIQSHIEQLLKWGNTSYQSSVNQPMLPYAVIVVNALDITVNIILEYHSRIEAQHPTGLRRAQLKVYLTVSTSLRMRATIAIGGTLTY